LAAGGSFSTSSGAKTVNGRLFMAFDRGGVIFNDGPNAMSYLSNSGCFQDALTHELGHTLGLDHSATIADIMYQSIPSSCFSGPRGLGPGDRAGVQFIYPTSSPCSPPDEPQNVKVAKSGNIITLWWSTPISGASPSYILQAGSSSGASNLFDASVGNTTKLQFQLPNGTYFFRVKAKNSCGTSGASNQIMVVVP
jgi:hypothetical protein